MGLLVFILFLLFTSSSILVSLNRFWQYEVFYYDFGIFDRAIWLASQFQAPIIDHLVVGGKIIFADHFSPAIFLFSPLFWLTQRSEVLLITQAVIVGISGLIIYKIGKIVTKNSLFSLAVLLSFYLFVGLQNAVITDWHEATIATLPLILTYYFFLKNKKGLALVFFLLTLGFKESNFVLGIGVAISLWLLNKQWRKFSLLLSAISIVWGIVSIKLIIPYFSDGIYQYNVIFSFDKLNLLTDLFDTSLKRETVFYSLFSFGFLPLLSPPFWFLVVSDFLVRFLAGKVGLGFHYSALLSVIMAISSFYSFLIIKKMRIASKHLPLISIILILNALFLYRFVLHGPLALSYNLDFYRHTKDFQFLDRLLAKIPSNVTVMTQNNLASRFTHGKNLWVLKDNYFFYDPYYVVLDMRSGQSANDFFPTQDPSLVLKNLLLDPNYSAVFNNQNQYVFKRKSL